MGRKLRGLHLLLLLLSTTGGAVQADYRRMAIDPSPSSPTLGDILDRNRPAPPRPAAKPVARPHPAPPAPPKVRSHAIPPTASRVGVPPVALAPAQPVKAKKSQPTPPNASEVAAPVLPPEMPTPLALTPVARPSALAVRGLAPVSARQPRPLTTLAAQRRELAADPIMTGTTVPAGSSGDTLKAPPAEVAQPLPATHARETSKTSEAGKAPEKSKNPEPVMAPEPGRTSEPPKISTSAPAAPSTSAESGRFVYVVDQDLRSFLTDFARRVGLRSEIAATVRGQITKVRLPAEPTALLKEIEKRHEIEWIIDGETLKVSSRGELATRILPLGKISYEELLRELKQVGVDTARYPLQPIGGSNAVILTAPAAHVARIAALVEALKAGKTTGPEIRIIRSGMTSKVNWE